jgi:hypothetical protein
MLSLANVGFVLRRRFRSRALRDLPNAELYLLDGGIRFWKPTSTR